MKKLNPGGQSSLEITGVFVALLLFLLGMLRIWFWGNNDLIRRQSDYIRTRGLNGTWPIHTTIPISDSLLFSGRN
jgi:hypothetical protein